LLKLLKSPKSLMSAIFSGKGSPIIQVVFIGPSSRPREFQIGTIPRLRSASTGAPQLGGFDLHHVGLRFLGRIMERRRILWAWWTALLAVAIAIPVCIRWVDYPVASKFLHLSKQLGTVGKIFGGRTIVAGEFSIIAGLTLARIKIGSLPEMAKILLVACSTSVMAYTLNDFVLKIVFGRQSPAAYYESHQAGIFHLFRGDDLSSFPSGHMTLAAAFLGVFFRLYSRARVASLLLAILGSIVLIVGDWHFISDVIAGTFLGFTTGLIVGELWIMHTRPASTQR
jgi:membrane-associated phospholipid phosphatase